MGTDSYLVVSLQAPVDKRQLNMGAQEVLAAVRNLKFKHRMIIFPAERYHMLDDVMGQLMVT